MTHVDYLLKQQYQHRDYSYLIKKKNLTGLESLTAPQNFVALLLR